ncbi:MAG TPA: PAS domain-containing protein, partial [Methylomirabilota bacterium]|nr:PAS domain-containing protein [Methylomirabilota bacterium]
MAVGRVDSNELLQLRLLALDAMANAVVITDRHGLIVWVNWALTHLTGFAANEAVGRTPTILRS